MRHIELNGELLEISASECWYVMDDARVEKTYSTSPDQINHDIGVYIFWGWDDKPIRIGKAVKARNRVLSYRKPIPQGGLPVVIEQSQHVSYIRTKDKRKASDLEIALIRKYRPKFNKQYND